MTIYRILFLLTIIFISPGLLMAETSFGILPMVSKNVSRDNIDEATTALYENLISSKKYSIVNRKEIKKVLREQAFQMTGATSQRKKSQMGRILGIEKIISLSMYAKGKKNKAINLSVIDVETGQVEFTREIYEKNSGAKALGRYTAAAIINEYPLISNVLGKAGNSIIVNMGSRHGLESGDRLFVARHELLRDAKGKIIFKETKRIALLRVTHTGPRRAKTKIIRLMKTGTRIQPGDLVSKEPIPKQAPKISHSPLIQNYRKGKLIIDDNMRSEKLLSVIRNHGRAYKSGALHMNSTANNTGHAYCYYSAPADNLADFILQGEFEFQQIKSGYYNKINIAFCSNADYTHENGYALFFNNIGQYEIDVFKQGSVFSLVSIRNTHLLKRGVGETNRFKIVAKDSRFDIYLNGKFLIGFEDYTFEKGAIGFKVNWGGYVTIDDVEIWKHRKR